MIPASVDIFDAEVNDRPRSGWLEFSAIGRKGKSQALPYRDSHPRPYSFVQRFCSDVFRDEVIFNRFDPFPFSV
jgi:hypothetical protein